MNKRGDIGERLLSSKEIVDRAIADYKPYAIVAMVSGGDDSLTALNVSKELNIPITHIMHGVTGTGIKQTTEFVRELVYAKGMPLYLEANAGSAYENYVMRKGFFGTGLRAHNYSYHILKWTHFRATVSKYIRHKKRNRKILFINGVRRNESENRMKSMINPIKEVGPNVWVNIINDWEKYDCAKYLDGERIERNPVSIKLCRSGECMCGTMQSKGDRTEATYFFPEWGEWIKSLEDAVKFKGFNWGWGENKPKERKPTAQMQMAFKPMCVGCIKDDPQQA